MRQVLQLESFRRAPAPEIVEPTFSADNVAQARREGEAAGRAAADGEAMAALTAVMADLADALRNDDARRRAIQAEALDGIGRLVTALCAALAGPLRAEGLAERIVQLIAADAADGEGQPVSIRCEAGAALRLRAALDGAGLHRIEVQPAEMDGAEYALGEGVVRVSPDRIMAQLTDIIAEIDMDNEGAHA